jgi:hypothetical protein
VNSGFLKAKAAISRTTFERGPGIAGLGALDHADRQGKI